MNNFSFLFSLCLNKHSPWY